MPHPIGWTNIGDVPPRSYTCGHCDNMVGSARGFSAAYKDNPATHVEFGAIHVCPHCSCPTFFQGDRQVPGTAYGSSVEHLPPEVAGLYTEARNCMSVGSYTAAVMACRTLLMHVAVSQGAPEGKVFATYVNFLMDEGLVPRNARGWVNHIRDKGNEAVHRITLMSRHDAETLLTFVEMILKLVFEYPSKVPSP